MQQKGTYFDWEQLLWVFKSEKAIPSLFIIFVPIFYQEIKDIRKFVTLTQPTKNNYQDHVEQLLVYKQVALAIQGFFICEFAYLW